MSRRVTLRNVTPESVWRSSIAGDAGRPVKLLMVCNLSAAKPTYRRAAAARLLPMPIASANIAKASKGGAMAEEFARRSARTRGLLVDDEDLLATRSAQ